MNQLHSMHTIPRVHYCEPCASFAFSERGENLVIALLTYVATIKVSNLGSDLAVMHAPCIALHTDIALFSQPLTL